MKRIIAGAKREIRCIQNKKRKRFFYTSQRSVGNYSNRTGTDPGYYYCASSDFQKSAHQSD